VEKGVDMARAEPFTRDEWKRIRDRLHEDPDRYGLPRREYGSVVAGSFNIRKLGNPARRDAPTWEFLADVCRRFDLLAVQEALDDLRGITRLKEMMGPEFALAVSDATGTFPGEPGVAERLAFIYNWNTVRRGEVASDISYDRSKLLRTLLDHAEEIQAALREYFEKEEAFERRERRTKPSFEPPAFILSFIRTPYLVAFEVVGHPSSRTYRLMAVNAHLLFGDTMRERRLEFDALMEWIIARVKQDSAYYKNFVLLGDLNLNFDDPARDRPAIARHLKGFDTRSGQRVRVVFPFLDAHPGHDELFRTNARLDETFDQIGLFYRPEDLPAHLQGRQMGEDTRLGPDYGMFNFVQLFSDVTRNRPYVPDPPDERTKEEQKEFLARFEHKVSDHMPIWLRIPLFEAPLLERGAQAKKA
jgi:hypothetical protein